MPLDETALEELGLAPRWVRRGMAAAPSSAESMTAASASQAVAVQAGQAVPDAAPRTESTPQPVAQRVATQASQQGADAQAPVSPQPPSDLGRGRAAAEPVQVAQTAQEEPPPLTEDDFAWFDAMPEPSLPHDLEPAPAPREDIATLDWDELAERVASCTRCRLCEKRTNTVFGVGDRSAEWMLIGEAPGENEDRLGEPFVGQAGKLLDNMLKALSLARGENVYIANVIKCRPPGNRNPEPDEVARCEPYLQRQVALVKPKIIVALGRFAAQSLLRTDGSIASLRGRVHQYEGVPVIVSYHPAYLLRSLHDKSKAWDDLCLARDTWRAAGGQR
ncbi:uracil-DNA glycosylase [Paraburkholderia sacchari]|uniref:uracil-DNA glycosylase n=1 Tax=Paraburkholderia sacchari TaxID=159450 RepID=UPI0005422B9A|nr:uracil-DNA glycosylase [Paraburkholderia sacchari]NLP64480.1 uracil-DNA glycosylase [Paraburkholderia sacchari]